MAKAAPGDEISITADDDAEVAKGGHGGSSVKQGMKGQSVRSGERGRIEYSSRGDSAVLDNGRASVGGRHYGGRPTAQEPPTSISAPPEVFQTGTVTFPPEYAAVALGAKVAEKATGGRAKHHPGRR